MRLFSEISRCTKLTNFYRTFASDVKSIKSSTNAIALNVIGSGAPGESASVSLSVANQDKYLFNCGEDSQRIFINQDRRIYRIKHIFATQTKWNCIGGISCITKIISNLQDELPMFHGPERLYKCIKRTLCLSILSELDFKTINCNSANYFEDDNVRIDFISIKVNPLAKKDRRPRDINEVLLFVGEVKTQSENSNTGEGCKLPSRFMIIDLPTTEHLQNFLVNHHWKSLEKSFDIVVHFSPQNIVKSRDYQNLVTALNAKKHLYLNESNECSRLTSVYELQMKLNGIDEKVHPPLKMPLDASKEACDLSQLPKVERNDSTIYSTYYLKRGSSSKNNNETIGRDVNVSDFQQSFDLNHLKTYPKIVFLGTVSAKASSIRNNTSILVHTTRNESIMMDCGEGTCGQIHRLYGKSAPTVIQKIKAIFVSHLHYDHFGGLVELLRMRKKYMPSNRNPLLVLSPKADLKSWLFFCDNNIDAIHNDLYFIDNENLMTYGLSNTICRSLGVFSLQTCRVPHYNISHALMLKIGQRNQFKLTFSSDTPPCDDLIALGRDSTLLIHEATYPDTFSQTAASNRHSTLSQAIEQSQRMNAKYTILTHFGKRHNFPIIDRTKHNNIGIAFDFMELTENDLPKLSSLYDQHRKLFS